MDFVLDYVQNGRRGTNFTLSISRRIFRRRGERSSFSGTAHVTVRHESSTNSFPQVRKKCSFSSVALYLSVSLLLLLPFLLLPLLFSLVFPVTASLSNEFIRGGGVEESYSVPVFFQEGSVSLLRSEILIKIPFLHHDRSGAPLSRLQSAASWNFTRGVGPIFDNVCRIRHDLHTLAKEEKISCSFVPRAGICTRSRLFTDSTRRRKEFFAHAATLPSRQLQLK